MKRKFLLGCMIGVMGATVIGCGAKPQEQTGHVEGSKNVVQTESQMTEEKEAKEEVTFEYLSDYSFRFCSGAGAWQTEFEIERDGTFQGLFNDSDMGIWGEGYEDGTRYVCDFSGQFKNLKKVNDLCYEMELDYVKYANEAGTEELADNVKYVYTDRYGLEGTDTYKIYLPGTSVSEFSEEIVGWLNGESEIGEVLVYPVIINEPMQYGIRGRNRLTANERASMKYNSYSYSYECYLEEIENASSTIEMLENAQNRYELADELLNKLWHILKYSVSEEQFQIILEEQREWIKEKEAIAEEADNQMEYGTMAPVMRADAQAEETMKRCEKLLEYIEEYAE